MAKAFCLPNRSGAFIASALAVMVAILLFNPCAARGADTSLVVSTNAGQLQGAARTTGGAEFLGVPYAQPPVGDLRWREPVPAKPWNGVREATAFGAPCAQPDLGGWNRHDAETGQEDCLFLNVITPSWPAKKPLPVMFWIHGGANEGGTASSALYKDGTLVQHGVVLVTVNYRLGLFGFFAHPGLTRESAHHASGNYGLMDQILALRWVRDNIANFGGDPNNITVFGQSAGSQDTGMLMTSMGRSLFERAIAESGAPFNPWLPPLAEAERAGEEFAAALKLPAGQDPLAAMRQVPAKELMAANSGSHRMLIVPDVDGWVIPRSPASVFASGQEAPIPLLIGVTTREFGSAASAEELRKMIQNAAGSLAPQVLKVYALADTGPASSDPVYGTTADQWAADSVFHCPATTEAIWHSAAQHPTYEYELAHAIPGHEAEGAIHSGDLPYVFGYFPKTGNIAGNFGDTDHKLADLVETYWTNFARTGNPNSDNLPHWPELGLSQTYLEFAQDGRTVTATGLRKPQCDVYREVLAERMKQH